MRKKRETTTHSFVLDKDLLGWVESVAEKRRCSMSQVIRDLILFAREKDRRDRKAAQEDSA